MPKGELYSYYIYYYITHTQRVHCRFSEHSCRCRYICCSSKLQSSQPICDIGREKLILWWLMTNWDRDLNNDCEKKCCTIFESFKSTAFHLHILPYCYCKMLFPVLMLLVRVEDHIFLALCHAYHAQPAEECSVQSWSLISVLFQVLSEILRKHESTLNQGWVIFGTYTFIFNSV